MINIWCYDLQGACLTPPLLSYCWYFLRQIFVSLSSTREEQKLSFEKTPLYHLLDRHQNTIRLIVHVPKMPVVAQGQLNINFVNIFIYFQTEH